MIRIEHPKPEQTRFTVEPTDVAPESSMALLDSTPAVICGVEAENPGAACSAAWEKGKRLLELSHGVPVYTADDFLRALDALRPPLLDAPVGPAEGYSYGPVPEPVAAAVRASLSVTYLACELEGGSWECPDPESPPPGFGLPRSPTGRCVYAPDHDPCRDRCLFCGLPDERK